MKKVFLFIITLMCSAGVFAQEHGKVVVEKDPRIDSLIARRLYLTRNGTPDKSSVVVYGYRVQIFFGPDRSEAYDAQARFHDLYPELGTYITYTQPNYRVKVGDFRSRSDAQRLLNELRSQFPALFIFSERINPRKADEYYAK